jgi:hypothetical protein
MNMTTNFLATPSRRGGAPGRIQAACGDSAERERDVAFIRMLGLYRSSGGLARADEVSSLFLSCNDLGSATLERWIARRGVLCIAWQSDAWFPVFQFDRQSMTVKSAAGQIFAALNPKLTPWDLAQWCAQPHLWLDSESPADTLDADADLVLRAACHKRLELAFGF